MAFAPTDYAGLVLWLKADAGIGVADGAAVGTWSDQSGKGNHATQATGGNQPIFRATGIGSLPAVDFDGSNDNLATAAIDLSDRNGATLYVVARPDTVAADAVLVESSATYASNAGAFVAYYDNTTSGCWVVGANNGSAGSFELWGAVPTASTAVLVTGRYDTSALRHAENGAVNGDPLGAYINNPKSANVRSNLGTYAVNIGSRNGGASLPFDGRIGEILLYRRRHTPDERIAVEAYLAARWGITVTTATVAAVYDGHSYTEGDGASPPNRMWWIRGQHRVSEAIDWTCGAKNGTTLEKFADDKLTADRWLETTLAKRIIASQCGTNDLQYSFSDSRTQQHYTDDWTRMLASNANYRATRTIMDRQNASKPGSWDTSQNTLNAYVAANVPAGVSIIDVAAITNLGADLAANDTTWFDADKVHPLEHPGETRIGMLWTDYLVNTVGLTRWSPSTLTGCVLWLKADALSLNDNDPVATWTDSSGSGNSATAAGGLQPTYKANILGTPGATDLPVVRFSGSNRMVTPSINLTGTSALTVFVVGTASAGATNQGFWELTTNYNSFTTGAVVFRDSSLKANSSVKGDVGYNTATSAANLTTTAKVIASYLDKSQAAANECWQRLNGTRATAGASNNANAFANAASYVGGRSDGTLFLTGDIAELLVFNRRLTTLEFRRVEAYLANRWGVY